MTGDDWKGEDKLRGIKRAKGEGNGYNLKPKALASRVEDQRRKSLKPGQYLCDRCERVVWGGDHVCPGAPDGR